ncbi:transglutaminase-like domain-containing protein [Streptomyces durmitorensis]|uniref:Transglutaminase-like domain-containing protein n=1 Tax=Streptomyces durmitorensis TaxID=319947 RepID=A0ABY4PSR4_9ACTN|nr:transglutaminase-like domain-containing protein [Streptomyces durmitorensis]UQT56482.1 transglutaminase-like domain-containing protein [Streptomyces durmitorensis]
MHPLSPERRRLFADQARSARPDLAQLCLLIGAEADPDLDEAGMRAARRILDRLAEQLAEQLAERLPDQATGPRSWALALAELLGQRYGFKGRPGDYQRLQSVLLHEVLRRRRGLPILLSVVWIEVARRAGAPVHGVALPGHFVVGFGTRDDQVLANPFAGGDVLSRTDAELMVAGATGAPLAPSMLSPAGPLDIVLRVLNNIRAWAAARPERSDVALWAVELSLLLPAHSDRLHYDRAQLLVQRGDFLTGALEIETYADALAASDEAAAVRLRQEAHGARAMLN